MKKKILLPALFMLIIAGCGAKPIKPIVSVYTLQDENYPCIQVEFPDQIKFNYLEKISDKDKIALLYSLAMPGYSIEVVKLYALEGVWNTESLPSLYDTPAKVFEILNTDNPDKSAVIVIEERSDGLYLKGSIGFFIQANRGVRVDISRPIKKAGTFKAYGIEQWQNSTIGQRSIENMKNIVTSIYKKLDTRECTSKDAINTDWWN